MKPARILITDDDPGIRTMVRVCLESSGYEIEEACDGLEALAAIRRQTPDLVMLDLAMPRMDGMTFLSELHELFPQLGVRVVVMTAHGSVKTAIGAMRLGASDFLEKPFVPDELRQSVASVLEDMKETGARGASDYHGVLRQVREALRAGTISAAETKLMEAGTITDDDPAFLNLAGVVHELRGRVDSARRFYERSARKDLHYQPAHDNLKRLGEMRRTGKSKRQLALGDDERMEEPGADAARKEPVFPWEPPHKLP